ncbi:CNNM domain-containing protein [Halococcus hamelinensis]|uniref:CBS domain-containing protein n=2 Tax=Halococcus hamelinensis TaxID=332168 RepID=M0LQK2_9EURY|nr:hemolysin family protein [Halococcus hamelinensis]EMA35847.1 CBS domain-containing protein [Halococcus hamelinensis 100A6]
MATFATGVQLLGGLTLLFSNGFFVVTEFALTRVRQFSESEFRGGSGLERAWEMTEELEIYLSGCQLGITISSVGLGIVAEPALVAVLDPAVRAVGLAGVLGGSEGHTALAVGLALVSVNLLHVIVGEQAPTYLGIERTKLAARYGAPVLYWWTTLLGPVIRFADWVAKGLLGLVGIEITRSWADEEMEEDDDDRPASRGEIKSRMGSILGGEIPDEREEEVLNALEIGETPVADVMVPREAVVALSTGDPTVDNLEVMRKRQHTRLPLVGDSLDEFVGVVYAPVVLANIDALRDGGRTLEAVATPPMTVPDDLPVSELIDRFQAESQELALVVEGGEAGGKSEESRVVGLVTTTDAFEAIAGDLEDPFD